MPSSSLPSRSATPNGTCAPTGLSASASASASDKAADDEFTSTIETKEESTSTNSPGMGMDQSIDIDSTSTTNSTSESAKEDVDIDTKRNNEDLPTDIPEHHTVPATETSLSLSPSIQQQSTVDGCGVTASSWFSSWFAVGSDSCSGSSPVAVASSPTKPVAPPANDNAVNLSVDVTKTWSRSSSSCKHGSSVRVLDPDKKHLVEGEDIKEDDMNMVPATTILVSNGSIAAAASAQEEDENKYKSSVSQQLEVPFNNNSGIHSNASTKAEDKIVKGKDEPLFDDGATSPSSSASMAMVEQCEAAGDEEEANAIASVVTSSTKQSRASRFSIMPSAVVLPKTMMMATVALSQMAGSKGKEEASTLSLGSQSIQKQKQTKTECMTQEQYVAAMEERDDDDDTQADVESCCDVDVESRTLESRDCQSVSSTLYIPRRRLATRTEKATFVLSTVLFVFIFVGIADTLRRQNAENTNATGAIEYTQENNNLPTVLNTSVFFETEYNPAVLVDGNNTSESSSASSVEEEEYNPVNDTVVLDDNATEAASEIVIIPHVPADEYLELDEEKVDERTGEIVPEDWYPGLGGGGNGIGGTNNPCPDGRKLVLVDDDGESVVENIPQKKKYLRDSGKNAYKERFGEGNKQRLLESKTGKCMKVGDSTTPVTTSNTTEEEVVRTTNDNDGNVGLTAASNTYGDSKAAKEHPNNWPNNNDDIGDDRDSIATESIEDVVEATGATLTSSYATVSTTTAAATTESTQATSSSSITTTNIADATQITTTDSTTGTTPSS